MRSTTAQATSTGSTAYHSCAAGTGLEQRRERGAQQLAASTWTTILRATRHTTECSGRYWTSQAAIDERGSCGASTAPLTRRATASDSKGKGSMETVREWPNYASGYVADEALRH